MIGDCDCCDRTNVPVSKANAPGEPTACFLCQGDTNPDPYCESATRDQASDALENAKISIIAAAIGSCDCGTMTNNPIHHLSFCRWLKLVTAIDQLDTVKLYLGSSSSLTSKDAP